MKIVDQSIQGVLGQQVTVKAQVAVAEGQSKAGIPVTLYVAGNSVGTKEAITVETVTDENGVATYTYTRYVAGEETVTVYATGDRSKFNTGAVHWGVTTQLTLTEVSNTNSLANGTNKTYKVKLVDESGRAISGKTLNVSLLENIDAEVNKLSTATVNGTVQPRQLANGTAPTVATVTTDVNGEAVITVSGTNTTATPVVFEDVTGDFYSPTLLQAKAPTVTFGALQSEYKLTITSATTSDAATGYSNARKFTVTVTDKDGKPIAYETVKLALDEIEDKLINTSTSARFVTFTNGVVTGTSTTGSVKTDAKGEATFYLGSTVNNDYGTPFAWIDINTSNASSNGVFENGEPFAKGDITKFTAPRLVSSQVVSLDSSDEAEDKFASNEYAKFDFELTNQSGKAFSSYLDANVASVKADFTVNNTGANDVVVFTTAANANAYISTGVNTGGVVVSPSRAETISAPLSSTASSIYVVSTATDKSTSVEVTASAIATKTDGTLATLVVSQSAKASFTSIKEVPTVITDLLTAFNTTSKTITFVGKDAVKYAGVADKTFTYKNQNGNTITLDEFETILKGQVTVGKTAKVTYQVSGDNINISVIAVGETGTLVDTVTAGANNQAAADAVEATIAALGATPTTASVLAANTAYNALTADQKALVDSASLTALETANTNAINAQTTAVPAANEAKYTSASWTSYASALALPASTLAEKIAKLTALDAANTTLVEAVAVTISGTTLTFTDAVTTTNAQNVTLNVDTWSATGAGTSAATASSNTIVLTIDPAYTPADGDTVTLNVTVNGILTLVELTYDSSASEWTITTPVSGSYIR